MDDVLFDGIVVVLEWFDDLCIWVYVCVDNCGYVCIFEEVMECVIGDILMFFD